MKNSTTFKAAITAVAITATFTCLASTASAQMYANRSNTYQTQSSYGTRAYSNPYTSGYGNNYRYNNNRYYNSYYNRPYVYRSPGSFDKSDDPYHRRNDSDLKRSKERFRNLRYDSRNQNNNYSNDKYKQNRPYDSRYYDRNIR